MKNRIVQNGIFPEDYNKEDFLTFTLDGTEIRDSWIISAREGSRH